MDLECQLELALSSWQLYLWPTCLWSVEFEVFKNLLRVESISQSSQRRYDLLCLVSLIPLLKESYHVFLQVHLDILLECYSQVPFDQCLKFLMDVPLKVLATLNKLKFALLAGMKFHLEFSSAHYLTLLMS